MTPVGLPWVRVSGLALCLGLALLSFEAPMTWAQPPAETTWEQHQTTLSVNRREPGYGIDPSTDCSDMDGNGMITHDECGDRDWSWTAMDPQIPAAFNNQNGAGVPAGNSPARVSQDGETRVTQEPHFSLSFYNRPSAPGTTASAGYTSTGDGSLRAHHNEFGFDIVVDKKNDPLEPYYLRFTIPYFAVDSTTDVNGDMIGEASITYEKIVVEQDPDQPGVFHRYTVTGTATSSGTTGSWSSTCVSGCPTDSNGFMYDPETGWTHPWQ